MAENRQSRSAEIAQTVRDEILRGRYGAGERLPSERDLAARFGASRSTVREALKRLEELGLATIQPGGARAADVRDCTLQILGPLLAVESANSALAGKVLELGGLLMAFAAETAVTRGAPKDIAAARSLLQDLLAPGCGAGEAKEALSSLFRLLVETSDHLVLTLIVNGLREQVTGSAPGFWGAGTWQNDELRQIAWKLDAAFEKGQAAQAGAAMQALFGLLRRRAGSHRASSREPVSVAASS